MPATVHARVPLSLLAAIRDVDSPGGDAEAEYVQELRNKRLGLSDTVSLQIGRYSDAVKRGQQIPFAEVAGLGTLIGRRADADALFQSAGRILAHEVYDAIAPTTRTTMETMPGFIARRFAFSQLKTIVERDLGGTLERTGGFLTVRVVDSVTVAGSPKSSGCVFYESALRELLRLLISGGDQVDHVLCSQSGDGACEWRAEWRTLKPKAS